MAGRWSERLESFNGLGFRLGFLLSIAILPIGLISVLQTLNLSREVEHAGEVGLLGRTSAAAAGERALIQGALGTADALGPTVLQNLDDPAACMATMQSFIANNATFVSATMVGMDGISRCNSSGREVDLRDAETYRKFLNNRTTQITASARGRVSNRSVVVVAQPLYRDRELLGFVSVSITHDLLRSTHASDYGQTGSNLLTFSNDGQVLSSYAADDAPIGDLLPRNMSLADLAAGGQRTFHDDAVDGSDRIFAVVPIVPGLAHALGSYTSKDGGFAGIAAARATAVATPLLLWLVSIAVAYLAVYRLVLRHVRELRGQMRRFAVGDRSELPRVIPDATAELKDVSRTFHNMARILMRDEQQLEEAVAEKTVLLKEVHHRVKNNLQLIASIINMQGRMIDDPDAKRVLRSVQDRVISLATIYRNLYQAEHLDHVDADRLLGDIVAQMAAVTADASSRISIQTDIQPLSLLPDQAVPLSLLATEALTNAIKYARPPAGERRAWVRLGLQRLGGAKVRFEVANSAGSAPAPHDSTGLGSQLIEAFATQLGAEVQREDADGSFRLVLVFDVEAVAHRLFDTDRSVVLTSAARDGATH